MNKLEIKDIWSDAGARKEDQIKFRVPDNGFMLVFELQIGTQGTVGADIFQFTLCDEKGLINCILGHDQKYIKDGITSLKGNSLFVIKHYDIDTVIGKMKEIINDVRVEDKSWRRIGMELSRYFNWEYENETISHL